MRLMPAISGGLLLSLVCPSAMAWRGREDNRPVAELELMDNSDLRWEMVNLCLTVTIEGALKGPNFRLDGIRYGQTIALVSRKRYSETSQVLMWNLVKAMGQDDPKQCERLHDRLIAQEKREKPQKGR